MEATPLLTRIIKYEAKKDQIVVTVEKSSDCDLLRIRAPAGPSPEVIVQTLTRTSCTESIDKLETSYGRIKITIEKPVTAKHPLQTRNTLFQAISSNNALFKPILQFDLRRCK